MASETEICNLAISHLGIGKDIASLETENSQEASTCRRFYETARDATLRDFPWSFAAKIAALGLVEEDPNDEWGFSYRYPSDCLRVIRILSGLRNDTRQSRVPYKIIQDAAGILILTDVEDAELEYTIRADDPAKYPPDFTMAFSYRLSAYIAPRITGGDNFGIGEKVLKLYLYEISRAEASNLNEQQVEENTESSFINERN